MLIHATPNIFYYFYYQNQKGTNKKKIVPGLYDPLYYNKPKRNKQKKSSQVYMIPYTIINKNEQAINFNQKVIKKSLKGH